MTTNNTTTAMTDEQKQKMYEDMKAEIIANLKAQIAECEEVIDYYAHPEKYGSICERHNTIVVNWERYLTIRAGEGGKVEWVFRSTSPMRFTKECAKEIVRDVVLKDIHDKRIPLEMTTKLTYFTRLKATLVSDLKIMGVTYEG